MKLHKFTIILLTIHALNYKVSGNKFGDFFTKIKSGFTQKINKMKVKSNKNNVSHKSTTEKTLDKDLCFKKENSLGYNEAIMVFEGNSARFECKICLSPPEKNNLELAEWLFSKDSSNTIFEPIEFTEHILLNPYNKSLIMYSLAKEQTGRYMCKLGTTQTPVHYLTVADSNELILNVKPDTALNATHAQRDLSLPQYNLLLTTRWDKWSPCSLCGRVGKHSRYGMCTVVYDEKSKNATNSHQAQTKEEEEAFNFLKSFPTGIPCKSHILPTFIRNIPEVKKRWNELMTGYCKEKCPEAVIFQVTDKNGNVLETANNSAGIYSMLQGLPNLEPEVQRRVFYEHTGEKIVLICPGNLNSDEIVQWQIGSKKIIPKYLTEQSHGRMFISMKDHLTIKRLHVSDSRIYSCWQSGALAGTIRLIVKKQIELRFNHHVMLLGLIIIMSTFVYVFLKAFLRRKHAKI